MAASASLEWISSSVMTESARQFPPDELSLVFLEQRRLVGSVSRVSRLQHYPSGSAGQAERKGFSYVTRDGLVDGVDARE